MITAAALYPDPDRPAALAHELSEFFAGLNYVRRVELFGSLATGRSDRWSDVDLLVVTTARFHGPQLLPALAAARPILYHTPLSLSEGHVLGVYFVDESPFHVLDLNFMAAAEYVRPDSRARFGPRQTLFAAAAPATARQVAAARHGLTPAAADLTTAHRQLNDRVHFTRKALRRYLRGQTDRAALADQANRLANLLAAVTDAGNAATGRLDTVAEHCLALAQAALAT